MDEDYDKEKDEDEDKDDGTRRVSRLTSQAKTAKRELGVSTAVAHGLFIPQTQTVFLAPN